MSKTDPAVRAVICDVYGTLLRVHGPPADAGKIWDSGCRTLTGENIPLNDFNTGTAELIAAANARRRGQGEPFPDADWLDILRTFLNSRSLPCLSDSIPALSDLHARCARTCTAMPGAADVLQFLRSRGVLTGLASNAQHYTRGELAAAGLAIDLFDSDLCFLSGEQGFAKPSPGVFQRITTALSSRGIQPEEIVMIGDSATNDMAPAIAAGWRTWQIDPEDDTGWRRFAAWLNVAAQPLSCGGCSA